MDRIKAELIDFHPRGVRSVGYALIAKYGYPKHDDFFDRIGEDMRVMRLLGEIPLDWIIDETRAIDRVAMWNDPVTLLNAAASQYRADPWLDQPSAVMVCCEKHGLSGVLRPVTERYRVPLATLGGACSASFVAKLAKWVIAKGDRQIIILYLGDFDPSGVQIPVWLHRDIFAFARVVDSKYPVEHYRDHVRVERLAINSLEQAVSYGGVPRPTEKETGKKNNHIGSADWPTDEATGKLLDSVEVDSIPPAAMQQMVREAIERHLDAVRFQACLENEAAERERLQDFVASYED